MYPSLLHHYHSSQAQGSLPALSCSSSSSSCTRRCMAIHHRSHTLLPPIFFLFTSTSSRRQPCLSSKSAVLARFRKTERSEGSTEEEEEHEDSLHPFDINLAVLLAGFAFESYNTPSENIWVHEVDGFDTETIFLSKQFLHDVYDGQLLIQLKRGRQFPGMDLWKVKDSWRVVNHRDIIPTVPRLMGYYHVAHPIYLSAGTFSAANVEVGLVEEGYRKDVIGEATPDFLVQEFMKGEKDLIQRLFQTEIAMLRALRDGSALMQHMEDFYYIALLERVSPSQASEITSKISQE